MSSKRKSGATPADNLDASPPDEGPVKPQIIDVTPDVVTDETPYTSPIEEPPKDSEYRAPASPPPPKKRAWPLPAAALLAGLIGGGWFYRDVLASYFPSDQVSTLQSRNAELQSAVGKLGADLEALKSAVNQTAQGAQSAAQTAEGAQQASAAVTANQKSTDTKVTKLADDVSSLSKRMNQLQTQVAAGATATASAAPDSAALTSLTDRVAKLEAELAILQSAKAAANADMTSASVLFTRANSGEPFTAELAAVQILMTADDLKLIEPLAAAGVPAASTLQAALPAITIATSATPAAEPEPKSWYQSLFSDFITITPIGERDWRTIIQQASDAGKSGGLTASIANLDAAEQDGALPPDLDAWRNKARQRIQLDGILQRINARLLQGSGG